MQSLHVARLLGSRGPGLAKPKKSCEASLRMSRLLSQLKSRWPEALFLSAWLVFLFLVPPQSRETSHKGRMVLAGLAVSLVGVEYWCRKRNIHEKAKRALTAAWLAASLFGVFNYYQFSAKQVTTVGDYADATYYYLNSK